MTVTKIINYYNPKLRCLMSLSLSCLSTCFFVDYTSGTYIKVRSQRCVKGSLTSYGRNYFEIHKIPETCTHAIQGFGIHS